MATGECNCGAVQFEIDADLSGVFVCHCSICRRFTGSNGIAVVVVPKDHFRWVRGQQSIANWKKPDTAWQGWFCSVCGSPVPGENDAATMFVPAGSITQGGDALKFIHHVWVGSKAGWDEIGDAGQEHTDVILAPVSAALLTRAAPRTGERVLDVGCGCGASTLDIARAVGPTGLVTALDISTPMLADGRRGAEAAGITNIDW